MSNFDPICEWVLRQEDATLSGKVVNLGDGAGLTRFGIAQEDNPGLPATFYTAPAAIALQVAKQIYRSKYWSPIHGDQITSDEIAASLFSFAVNDGPVRAVKEIQSCVGVTVDGVMGPDTLLHINAYNPAILGPALREAQADFYRAIVAQDLKDTQFLNGWLARAERVYPNLT